MPNIFIVCLQCDSGKDRPLQRLIDTLDEKDVIESSTEAFSQLQEGKITEARDALTKLKV